LSKHPPPDDLLKNLCGLLTSEAKPETSPIVKIPDSDMASIQMAVAALQWVDAMQALAV
jgi:hypothetical protein